MEFNWTLIGLGLLRKDGFLKDGFSRMDSQGFSKDGFAIATGQPAAGRQAARGPGPQDAPWGLHAGRPAAIENPSFENPSSRIHPQQSKSNSNPIKGSPKSLWWAGDEVTRLNKAPYYGGTLAGFSPGLGRGISGVPYLAGLTTISDRVCQDLWDCNQIPSS